MNEITLIIADPDPQFIDFIADILKLYPYIKLIDTETNGTDTLRAVRELKPDALLFDLLLPGIDGISLLRSINEFPNPPATICCTIFYSSVALEALRIFGASYILHKPVEEKSFYKAVTTATVIHQRIMLKRTHDITQETDGNVLHIRVRNYIVSLGISSKLIGCSFLTEATIAALEDMTLTQNLSRGLYNEIAQKMQTTSTCVERSIRNAISSAYYGNKLSETFITCPSNKEFIKYILQNIPFR